MTYTQKFTLSDMEVDCFGKLKLSALLYFAQEVAGKHCIQLGADYETLQQKNLFWAVTRHRVQITRLPVRGETITVETWPMPTTRVAYPRSMVAYDADGNELFRSISLWVLINGESRAMVLPGKSGVDVTGTLKGTELASPRSLSPAAAGHTERRTVTYSCLDRNGHMNNTRYYDLSESCIGRTEDHPRRIVTEHQSEIRLGESMQVSWGREGERYFIEGVNNGPVFRMELDYGE